MVVWKPFNVLIKMLILTVAVKAEIEITKTHSLFILRYIKMYRWTRQILINIYITGEMIMSYGLIAVIIVIGIVIGAIATKKCEPFLIGGSIIGAIFYISRIL